MADLGYREALAYLYDFANYEKKGMPSYSPIFYDLARMEKLLARVGSPHRA